MSMVEMIPERLYAGGTIRSFDWNDIAGNITAIINLRTKQDRMPNELQNQILMIWKPLNLLETPDLKTLIDLVYKINVLLDSGHRVLIHCKQGRERTGLVITGLYMLRFHLGRDQALALAREKKPDIHPPSHFMGLLKQYERYLNSN